MDEEILDKTPSMEIDVAFYLSRYPDVAESQIDATSHYDEFGWREGRDPSPWFSTHCYLEDNPDVGAAAMNPFAHYHLHGRGEGRRIYPAAVDSAFYMARNSKLIRHRVDPIRHYHDVGWKQGRDPAPWFSTKRYLDQYPDVKADGVDPFQHYLIYGRHEGRSVAAAREPLWPLRLERRVGSDHGANQQPSGVLHLAVRKASIALVEKTRRFLSRHATEIGIIAAIYFHLRWRWKDYPRTLRQDIKAIRRHFSNPTTCRQQRPIFAALLQVSDPTSVPWDQVHDTALLALPQADHLCLKQRRLGFNTRFLVALFASLLKRTGDVASARLFYQRLERTREYALEGLLGQADVAALMAGWKSQLAEYIARNMYPAKPLVPMAEVEPDLMSELQEFSYNQALEFYRRAHELAPENPFVAYHLAHTLTYLDDWKGAVGWFMLAHNAYPNNSIFKIYMLYARVLTGELELIPEIRSVLSLNENLLWEFGDLTVVDIKDYKDIPYNKKILLRREKLNGKQVIVHNGNIKDHNFEIVFPKVFYGSIPEAHDLGWGTKMIYGKYLIADSRHLSLPELKLFCRSIIMSDGRKALIGIRYASVPRLTKDEFSLPGAVSNYYHWMFDSLAALMHLSGRRKLDELTVLLSPPLTGFQEDSLRLCFHDRLRLELLEEPWPRFRFDEMVHLPYCARYNVPHPASVRVLKAALSRAKEKPTPGRRLYVTRQALPGRKTVNEARIFKMVEQKGFIIYDPVGRTLEEQISDFSDAEVVVSAAGAALTNLIFCPSTTRVVIIESAYHRFETFSALVAALNLQCWVCAGKGVTKPNPYFVWSIFDMTVNETDLGFCLDAALASLN